ncbi:Uncharacterised protein [Chlamydia trachomatis]|nr:Uncharacterised protein [Chlamydia trachomatis]
MNPAIMARDRYINIISVYVRTEQSAENLARIPLEQFEDVLSYINYENIDHNTITLI